MKKYVVIRYKDCYFLNTKTKKCVKNFNRNLLIDFEEARKYENDYKWRIFSVSSNIVNLNVKKLTDEEVLELEKRLNVED